MATITTSTPFATGTAMVAGTWNNKYDLLYNELNGNLSNDNFASGASCSESKVVFSATGHDHGTGGGGKIAYTSFSTASATKGVMLYYTGSAWAFLGTGAEGDQLKLNFDTYTKMVLHLDNASTDACSPAKTITNTDVTFSNTIAQFNGYSGYFNGTSAYLQADNSNDWDFGDSDDFTVDFWAYFPVLPASGENYILFSQRNSTVNYGLFRLTNTGGTMSLVFNYLKNDGNDLWNISHNVSVSANTWYHIAVVRSSGTFYTFLNGALLGTGTATNTGYAHMDGELLIGVLRVPAGAFSGWLVGYIDEFRWSLGVARWTSNFNVPTEFYKPDLVWS